MKIILLICNIFLISPPVHAESLFSEKLNSANRIFDQKDYPKALDVLKKSHPLAKTEKDQVILYNSIGWTYFNNGNNNEAINYLEKALQGAIKINNTELAQKTSNNLGIIYYSLGNIDKSKEYFTNSWSKNSETSKNYLSLIKEQEEANRINSILSKGISFRLNTEFEKAIIEYEKVLSISPDNIKALDYKGYALFRLGKYEEALVALQKANSIKPENINTLINLMKTNCALKQPDNAAIILKNNKIFLEKNRDSIVADSELISVCGEAVINNF